MFVTNTKIQNNIQLGYKYLKILILSLRKTGGFVIFLVLFFRVECKILFDYGYKDILRFHGVTTVGN